MIKLSGPNTSQRCTQKYVFIFFMVMIAFCVYGVNWKQKYEVCSTRKQLPGYTRSQRNRIDRMYSETSNLRTLEELMVDKDTSPVFTSLANVTLNRRSLPNYFIHGLNSARKADYSHGDIAFVHVHKSGGTTMKAKLGEVCEQSGMDQILMAHRKMTAVYDHYLQEGRTSKPSVFFGGYSFGICDVLHGRPCSYMTVLRDPFDRLISAYFFCQGGQTDKLPLCGPVVAKNVSITAWAIHQGSHFFNQLLVHSDTCRHLYSRYEDYVKPYQQKTEHIIKYTTEFNNRVCWFRQMAIHRETLTPEQRRALLLYILDHLDQWFTVIGLLQEYQLSLELFREAYNLPFISDHLIQANKGKVRNKTESNTIAKLKEELRNSEAVRQALYEDIMIYEKAKEIFELQKEKYYHLKQL